MALDYFSPKGALESIESFLEGLVDVKETLMWRDVTGWPPLMHDEVWIYHTERDPIVCEFCKRWDGTISRGDYIPNRFPNHYFITPIVISPNLHDRCRCVLEWSDSTETIKERLQLDVSLSSFGEIYLIW